MQHLPTYILETVYQMQDMKKGRKKKYDMKQD